MIRRLLILLCLLAPPMVAAESYENIVRAKLLPGWRLPDGSHMAGLHLQLAPGWKTYWRAPGDAGIPPQFQWKGGKRAGPVHVHWPSPKVFSQSGMRSIGYSGSVTLPLRIPLQSGAGNTRLKAVIDIGICKDVCLPHRIRVATVLRADQTRPDSSIAAALADEPYRADEAGISQVACSVSANENGLTIRAKISMPKGTGQEQTAIETANPEIWVSEPRTWWEGNTLLTEAHMTHLNGGVFALDRSKLRITILGGTVPVDIQGCTS